MDEMERKRGNEMTPMMDPWGEMKFTLSEMDINQARNNEENARLIAK
jgi:hypothetical protein